MALSFWSLNISAFQKCQQLKRMKGLPGIGFKAISICESCLFGKMSHQPFAKSKTVTEFPLQLVHTDMCGPFPVPSLLEQGISFHLLIILPDSQ